MTLEDLQEFKTLADALRAAGIEFRYEYTGGGINVLHVDTEQKHAIWASPGDDWNGKGGWLVCFYTEPYEDEGKTLAENVDTAGAVETIRQHLTD